MIANQHKTIARQKPFKAFYVTLKSGESLFISKPLRALIFEQMALFGVNDKVKNAEKMRIVNLDDIVAVEAVHVA